MRARNAFAFAFFERLFRYSQTLMKLISQHVNIYDANGNNLN